ncbi:membrane hypothetical protein [Marinoscillum sp. 108]|nr:membrane hypothetical protein [Marinoscillum sp. 108]
MVVVSRLLECIGYTMKTIPLFLFICWILALIAYFISVLGLIRTKNQKTFNTYFLNQIDQLLYLLILGLPGAMIISMFLMGTGNMVSMTLLLFTGLICLLPAWIGLRMRLRLLEINKHSSINFNDNWSQFELINDKESEIFPNSTETHAMYFHFNNPRTPWGQYGILILTSNSRRPVSTMLFDFPRYEKQLRITVERKSVRLKEFNSLLKAL